MDHDAFKNDIVAIAKRGMEISGSCKNEESAKHYLVLPFLDLLGYDIADPQTLRPEYDAGFRHGSTDRVDYVIMSDANPAIAIECKAIGTDLEIHRGQLREYFSALPSVRLGILTDGIKFEFFVDLDAPNIMDDEPFLMVDIEAIAMGGVNSDVLEMLRRLTQRNFEPVSLLEAVECRMTARRLRTALTEEVQEPSEDFCRFILQRIGVTRIRRDVIESRYRCLVKKAFEQAFIFPVIELLQRERLPEQTSDSISDKETLDNVVTTDRELSIYRYICRRLAFLAENEAQFLAIENVHHRDYIGKFAVYYKYIRKGRLFDFIEGENGFDKFIFPAPYGEIVTNSIADIDEPLRQVFFLRVRQIGGSGYMEDRISQIA